MKIVFLALGKKRDPLFAEGVLEFTDRISRYVPVEWKIIPAAEGAGSDIERAKTEEGKRIESELREGDVLILLDEIGKEYSSVEFSQFLQKRFNEGPKRLIFVVGGAYGISAEISARASHTISLSRLTFPHQLVRLVLAEQVYRALSISKGEKYHHV